LKGRIKKSLTIKLILQNKLYDKNRKYLELFL